MATKTIAWTTGSGNITLTYTGQGNGSISVASSVNDSFDDRSQSFNIVTTNGTPEQAVSILVKQKGKTYPVGEVFNFAYTGSVQQITLPKGKYKLQCWGAQGGNVTGSYAVNGSKGGYSEGVITLTKTTTLYVFVGGQGTSYTSSSTQTSTTQISGGWNGGGAALRTSRYDSGGTDGRSFPRGGGGATDISTVTSAVNYGTDGRTTRDSASLLARCIVAGGGAGASATYTINTSSTSSWTTLSDDSGYMGYTNYTYWQYYARKNVELEAGVTYRVTFTFSGGGTRYVSGFFDSKGNGVASGMEATYTPTTSGTYEIGLFVIGDAGLSITYTMKLERYDSTTTTSTSTSYSSKSQQGGGESGKGQYPGKQLSAGNTATFGFGQNQNANNYRYCGGGGGGGWFGGGTSRSDSSTGYVNYSGGGSGFVNISANASSRPSGYTGLQLDSGTTTAGNSSFPSTSGGTETGHSGNGYARITVIE